MLNSYIITYNRIKKAQDPGTKQIKMLIVKKAQTKKIIIKAREQNHNYIFIYLFYYCIYRLLVIYDSIK